MRLTRFHDLLRDAVDRGCPLESRAQAGEAVFVTINLGANIDLRAAATDDHRATPDVEQRQVIDRGGVPLKMNDVRMQPRQRHEDAEKIERAFPRAVRRQKGRHDQRPALRLLKPERQQVSREPGTRTEG